MIAVTVRDDEVKERGINLRFRDQKGDRNQHDPRPDQKDIKGPAPGDIIIDKTSDNGSKAYAGVRNARGVCGDGSYLDQ
jgi:hypothetical protein